MNNKILIDDAVETLDFNNFLFIYHFLRSAYKDINFDILVHNEPPIIDADIVEFDKDIILGLRDLSGRKILTTKTFWECKDYKNNCKEDDILIRVTHRIFARDFYKIDAITSSKKKLISNSFGPTLDAYASNVLHNKITCASELRFLGEDFKPFITTFKYNEKSKLSAKELMKRVITLMNDYACADANLKIVRLKMKEWKGDRGSNEFQKIVKESKKYNKMSKSKWSFNKPLKLWEFALERINTDKDAKPDEYKYLSEQVHQLDLTKITDKSTK